LHRKRSNFSWRFLLGADRLGEQIEIFRGPVTAALIPQMTWNKKGGEINFAESLPQIGDGRASGLVMPTIRSEACPLFPLITVFIDHKEA
jgi:hypothetical protein